MDLVWSSEVHCASEMRGTPCGSGSSMLLPQQRFASQKPESRTTRRGQRRRLKFTACGTRGIIPALPSPRKRSVAIRRPDPSAGHEQTCLGAADLTTASGSSRRSLRGSRAVPHSRTAVSKHLRSSEDAGFVEVRVTPRWPGPPDVPGHRSVSRAIAEIRVRAVGSGVDRPRDDAATWSHRLVARTAPLPRGTRRQASRTTAVPADASPRRSTASEARPGLDVRSS
jgi:hypothetical protein